MQYENRIYETVKQSNRTTKIVTISIKIFDVNFAKSILDNSKSDKTNEGIAKKSISATE